MKIQFSADDVKVNVAKDAKGQLAPSLAAARNGYLLLEITRAELKGMLMAFAEAAAKEQGAKVEDAELTLSSVGPRAVAASLRVKAKKSFIPAVVTVEGQADIDERLTVTLSNLRAAGEGMVGGVVGGLIGAKLKEFEGKRLDVAPPAIRNVRLHELRLDPADPVRVTAQFEG
ncbi:MAG TPA: hypothetical protein VF796_22590 [Humisphaera sp.]